jgi:hypothetical protein
MFRRSAQVLSPTIAQTRRANRPSEISVQETIAALQTNIAAHQPSAAHNKYVALQKNPGFQ